MLVVCQRKRKQFCCYWNEILQQVQNALFAVVFLFIPQILLQDKFWKLAFFVLNLEWRQASCSVSSWVEMWLPCIVEEEQTTKWCLTSLEKKPSRWTDFKSWKKQQVWSGNWHQMSGYQKSPQTPMFWSNGLLLPIPFAPLSATKQVKRGGEWANRGTLRLCSFGGWERKQHWFFEVRS